MQQGRTQGRINHINRPEENNVKDVLERARLAHEKYLVRSDNRDLKNAIGFYIQAIKMDPSVPESYYRLASLLWENGEIDIDAAINQCSNAVRLAPTSSNAHLYKGYFLNIAERFEEAELEFLESIKLNKMFSARPRIALSLTLLGKMRESGANFRDFTRSMYYFASGSVMIGWDYASMRMLYRNFIEDFAVFSYKLLGSVFNNLKNYNMALKTYEKAVTQTGRGELFYTKIADISLKRGESNIAIDCYKKALDANPNNKVLWAKLATTLQTFDEDNVENIIDCYNNLVELEPQNARIYYELGHLYMRLDDKFSTVNAFKRAVEIDDENPFYHNSLAYAYICLEDYNSAVEEYKRAIMLNPNDEWTSIVYQALGSIYYEIKDNTDAAINAYQTALALDKNNVDAYVALGEIYQEEGDLNKAIENYCQAVKLNPDLPKTYCRLGLVLWEKEYIEESLIAYHKAIELDDNYSIAYNNMGVVYLDGAGYPDEALEAFSNAIKCNPNYTLAYYNKGRAYQTLGEKTQAAEFYQMASDLNKLTEDLDPEEIEDRLYALFSV